MGLYRHGRRWWVLAVAALLVACGSGAGPSSGSALEGHEVSELPTFPAAPSSPSLPQPPTASAAEPQYAMAVFDDIQATWEEDFARSGLPYTPARLNLFSSSTAGRCGPQTSDVGPFYCPSDKTVNLDLGFFDSLERQFGVGNDFAQAYVIAHEVGHHIQNLLGISARVAAADARDPGGSNALSVKVELQADCFAGVWAHSVEGRGELTPADVQDALHAAAVVGDDFLQQLHSGQVEPESWTHGSSAQRQHWLTVGLDSGRASSCNTFQG